MAILYGGYHGKVCGAWSRVFNALLHFCRFTLRPVLLDTLCCSTGMSWLVARHASHDSGSSPADHVLVV